MNKDIDIDTKFERVIGRSAIAKIQDISIFRELDGSYTLFNLYDIAKTTGDEYQVSVKKTHTVHTFYSLKNAVTWCSYDKQNKIVQAKRIIELDQKLCGVDMDVLLHKKLFRTTKNADAKLVYVAKLNEDKIKKAQITRELYRFIDNARSWQQNRFNSKSL